MSSVMKLSSNDLQTSQTRQNYTACIVGCGRTGLVTAGLFVEAGFKVIGVDSNSHKIHQLKKGISPNVTDFSEKTPLHYTAECYHSNALRIIDVLHQSSAVLDARDNAGWTPLMNAAHHANIEVVNKLLDLGCSVKDQGNNGETALHLACKNYVI